MVAYVRELIVIGIPQLHTYWDYLVTLTYTDIIHGRSIDGRLRRCDCLRK